MLKYYIYSVCGLYNGDIVLRKFDTKEEAEEFLKTLPADKYFIKEVDND